MGVIAGLLFVNTSAPAGPEVACWRDQNWTSVVSWLLTFLFLYHIQRYMWVMCWLKLPLGGAGIVRRLREEGSLHAFIELFANRWRCNKEEFIISPV